MPNGTFNYSDTCQIHSLSNSEEFEPWFSLYDDPNEFHPCFPEDKSIPENWGGGGLPYSGEGYIGLYVFWTYTLKREYKSVELIEPLVSGVGYHARFHVSRMDSCWFATRNIGMLLSEDVPDASVSHLLSVQPQVSYESNDFLIDKDGWMTVEGSFVANGGERYLTIGNFDDDANTDTLFVPGGGIPPAHSDVFWSSAYYYVDGVSVIPDSVHLSLEELSVKNEELKLWPNPVTSVFNIDVSTRSSVEMTIVIRDLVGKEVYRFQPKSNTKTIDISTWARGMYHCSLYGNSQLLQTEKVVLVK